MYSLERKPRVLTMANLKGGSGKTTSTAFLLHTLHRLYGPRVIGVDADPQGSLLRWSGMGEWSIPVFAMASKSLHRQLFGVVDRSRYDIIVIDTPPLEQESGIVASALWAASDVIVPMAPTMMELDRVGPVFAAIEDASDRPDRDEPLPARVLLNRTVSRASATQMTRDELESRGHGVYGVTIPHRTGLDGYGQAFGGPVDGNDAAYSAVAAELLAAWSGVALHAGGMEAR